MFRSPLITTWPALIHTEQGATAMIQQNTKTKEISLGEDFGDVAVKVNGVRVEVHTDGSILHA
jgi:hypothetical protein